MGNALLFWPTLDFDFITENSDRPCGRFSQEAVPSPPLTALHAFQKEYRPMPIIYFGQRGNRGLRIGQHFQADRDKVPLFGHSAEFGSFRVKPQLHSLLLPGPVSLSPLAW